MSEAHGRGKRTAFAEAVGVREHQNKEVPLHSNLYEKVLKLINYS